LLVGGTMMYFRALTEGIAELPSADDEIRASIDAEAAELGWPAVHARLRAVDPTAAARINPNDSQRIQRALEVYKVSGRPLSEWQEAADIEVQSNDVRFTKIALRVEPRSLLHERIGKRLDHMLENGFLDEMRRLMQRPELRRESPSMRSVGYRQFWPYVADECSLEDATSKALAATRQLAKRQITWLRSESSLKSFDPLDSLAIDAISAFLAPHLD